MSRTAFSVPLVWASASEIEVIDLTIEWSFGRSAGESNMLPSPLNFQTPIRQQQQQYRHTQVVRRESDPIRQWARARSECRGTTGHRFR